MNKLRKILDKLYGFVETFSAFLLAVTCGLVLAQVISRYFFGYSFVWAEELPVIFFAWFGFLGAAAAMHRKEHLGVEIVTKKLPTETRKFLNITSCIVGTVFFVVIFIYGLQFSIKMMKVNFISMSIPKGVFYLSIVICSLLMVITLLFQAIDQIVRWKEE